MNNLISGHYFKTHVNKKMSDIQYVSKSLGPEVSLIKRMGLCSESANTLALVSGVWLLTGCITGHCTYTFKSLAFPQTTSMYYITLS